MFVSRTALAISALALTLPAVVRARLGEPSDEADLCEDEVVAEVCGLISRRGALNIDHWRLNLVLSMSGMDWYMEDVLLLPEGVVSCAELCRATVRYLRTRAWPMPQARDTGCYRNETQEVVCDWDLSAPVLRDAVEAPEEQIDEGSGHAAMEGRGDAPNRSSIASADSSDDDELALHLAIRIAGLFRVFPLISATPARLKQFRDNGSVKWRDVTTDLDTQKRNLEAFAWVTLAIRHFGEETTDKHILKWFGEGAVSSISKRETILSALNSAAFVLLEVVYRRNSWCERGTLAWVYGCEDARDGKGNFKVNLCHSYFQETAPIQVGILVHEALHHQWKCVDDIKYGRGPCKKLAKNNPKKALNNADSIEYFVQDVAKESCERPWDCR